MHANTRQGVPGTCMPLTLSPGHPHVSHVTNDKEYTTHMVRLRVKASPHLVSCDLLRSKERHVLTEVVGGHGWNQHLVFWKSPGQTYWSLSSCAAIAETRQMLYTQ